MAKEFAFSRDTGYLYVDQLEPNLASRITDAMRQMIERTRAGKVRTGLADKPYGTTETIEQYVESLAELSLLIPPPMEKQAGT